MRKILIASTAAFALTVTYAALNPNARPHERLAEGDIAGQINLAASPITTITTTVAEGDVAGEMKFAEGDIAGEMKVAEGDMSGELRTV